MAAKMVLPSGSIGAAAQAYMEAQSSSMFSKNFLKFVPGHEYKVRLLNIEDDREDSPLPKFPLYEMYEHGFYDRDNKVSNKVTCPTTFHGKSGFKMCAICEAINPFYKSDNPADNQIYKKFRREFSGYVLVYVECDTNNPKNDNTVKIMRYGNKIDAYLKQRVFGIIKKKKDDKPEDVKPQLRKPLQDKAFFFPGVPSKALIVTVGSEDVVENGAKRTYNSYTCEFDSDESTLDLDMDKLAKEIETINFFALFQKSTDAEIRSYLSKHILHTVEMPEQEVVQEEVTPVAAVASRAISISSKPKTQTVVTQTSSVPMSELIGDEDEEEVQVQQVTKPVVQVAKPVVQTAKVQPAAASTDDITDAEINLLVAGLNNPI